MNREVEYLSPQDTVLTAARTMRDSGVGFLPVCDSSRRVLGTLTDRDLAIRIVAENRHAATKVNEVMMPELVSCKPEDDLRHAQLLMGRNHKSRLVCLDTDGRLAGVISLSDIAKADSGGRALETLRRISGK
jgi:CBS domain-containing protein